MTHIPDLVSKSYSGLTGPIRAVGWLESHSTFHRGKIDQEFARRLISLIEYQFFDLGCFGFHYCSICKSENKIGPSGTSSQNILLVPASDYVYETPIWIGHYVIGHHYSPPNEFCRAVMSSPKAGSDEYFDALAKHIPTLSRSDFVHVPKNPQETLLPDPEGGSEELLQTQVLGEPFDERCENAMLALKGQLSKELFETVQNIHRIRSENRSGGAFISMQEQAELEAKVPILDAKQLIDELVGGDAEYLVFEATRERIAVSRRPWWRFW